jgi:hypothetical protein
VGRGRVGVARSRANFDALSAVSAASAKDDLFAREAERSDRKVLELEDFTDADVDALE